MNDCFQDSSLSNAVPNIEMNTLSKSPEFENKMKLVQNKGQQ